MKYFYKERDWIYFGFDFDQNIIKTLKSFNCKYNSANREWYLQLNDSIKILLQDFIEDYSFVEVDINEVDRNFNKLTLKKIPEMLTKQDIINFIPDLNLNKQPRSYQIDSLYYICNHGNCVNGSAVGTGKTLSTIFFCELLDLFPCIVVCPCSVKNGWKKEWLECNPNRKVTIVSSNNTKTVDFSSDVIIINYDLLGKQIKDCDKKAIVFRFPEFEKIKPKLLVSDEIHYLKNENSIRHRIFKRLSKKAQIVHGLSGTLIMNRPNELIGILRVLGREKDIASDSKYFYQRYCNSKYTRFGIDVKGSINIKELHEILKHYCYFRIEKKDALKDLPPTIEQYIECEISNKKIYNEAVKDFMKFLKLADSEKVEKANKAKQLVKVNYLKQLSLDGKFKAIEEFLRDWIESNLEEKIIVFSVHIAILEKLKKSFKNSVLITGAINQKQKEHALQQFQTDKDVQILFANMQCIGTGTDGLQKICSNIALLEFPQKPSELVQVIGRIERSEQKFSTVVYYLMSNQTIDKELWKMLKDKKDIVDIVNAGYVDDTSLLLINSYQKVV